MLVFINKFQRRLTPGFLHTLFANVLILLINVLTGIISARALGPEGRGIQAAVILWPQFLAYLFTLGLPTAVVYYGKLNYRSLSQVASVSLLTGLILGSFAALVGVEILPYVLNKYSHDVILFAKYLLILTPISLLGVIVNSFMQMDENYKLYNVFRYFPPTISLIFLALLYYSSDLNPFNSALVMSLPQVPVLFLGLWWIFRTFSPNLKNLISVGSPLIGYGLKAYGIDLIRTMADQIDKVLVVGVLNPTLMGYYVVALSISRILNTVQLAASVTLLPRLIKKDREEIVALTLSNVKSTAGLSMAILIFLFFLGPKILTIFYGTEFQVAVPIFRILLFEALLTGIAWVLSQAFIAIGVPGLVTTILAVSLIIGAPVMFELAKLYEIDGIGYGLLFIALLKLIMTSYFYKVKFFSVTEKRHNHV